MNEKALLTQFWTSESKTTRKVFARIPEASDYRPDPRSRTAAEIAWQIVCEAPPPMPATMKEVIVAYERQSAGMEDRWKNVSDERWDGQLEFLGKQRPAAPMAWSFLFDIVHHRGQLTTDLRPMGSTVPQVYGPSAAEP